MLISNKVMSKLESKSRLTFSSIAVMKTNFLLICKMIDHAIHFLSTNKIDVQLEISVRVKSVVNNYFKLIE